MESEGMGNTLTQDENAAGGIEDHLTSRSETLFTTPAGILGMALTTYPLSLPVIYLIVLFVIQ
ncbi:MAG: hypothetical protein ACM3ON_11745 [Chloroflexota bacterium]